MTDGNIFNVGNYMKKKAKIKRNRIMRNRIKKSGDLITVFELLDIVNKILAKREKTIQEQAAAASQPMNR